VLSLLKNGLLKRTGSQVSISLNQYCFCFHTGTDNEKYLMDILKSENRAPGLISEITVIVTSQSNAEFYGC
jgi:hypothetical protein